MAAIHPADYADSIDRTPATRYFACGDRLDLAIMRNDSKRVSLLRYAQDILAMETREALEQERQAVSKATERLIAPLLNAFRPTP